MVLPVKFDRLVSGVSPDLYLGLLTCVFLFPAGIMTAELGKEGRPQTKKVRIEVGIKKNNILSLI